MIFTVKDRKWHSQGMRYRWCFFYGFALFRLFLSVGCFLSFRHIVSFCREFHIYGVVISSAWALGVGFRPAVFLTPFPPS